MGIEQRVQRLDAFVDDATAGGIHRVHGGALGWRQPEVAAAERGMEDQQARDDARVLQRGAHGDAGAERDAAEDDAVEAEVVDQGCHVVGEDAPIERAGIDRPSAAAEIGRDDPEALGEGRGKQQGGLVVRQPTVKQHDRGAVSDLGTE